MPSISELEKYFNIYIYGGSHETPSCSIENVKMLFLSIEIAIGAIGCSEDRPQKYIVDCGYI